MKKKLTCIKLLKTNLEWITSHIPQSLNTYNCYATKLSLMIYKSNKWFNLQKGYVIIQLYIQHYIILFDIVMTTKDLVQIVLTFWGLAAT